MTKYVKVRYISTQTLYAFIQLQCIILPDVLICSSHEGSNEGTHGMGTTRNQINDTFLFQNRVKVKVVGDVSEK